MGFTYDGNNRLQQVYYQYGRPPNDVNRSWLFAYNPDGTLKTVTDPTGAVTTFTWQNYTRSDGVQLPLINKITNPRGNPELTVNTYDSSGRMVAATFADGGTLTATYHAAIGTASYTEITDPTGDYHRWDYTWNSDSTGYLITSTTNPLHRVTTLARALAPTNLITGITDFRNRTATLGWDAGTGNLRSLTLPTNSGGTATWSATYDPTWNQLTSVTEPPPVAGAHQPVTSYQVDPATGNTTAVTDPRGYTTQYLFNPDGTIQKVMDPFLKLTSYGPYDTDGDVLVVTDPLAHKWQYGFNLACQVVNVTDPNGKIVRYDHDLMDRPTSRSQTVGTTTFLTQLQYDPNGNLHTLTDANNHVWEWDFDNLDRLNKELNPLSQAMTYVWNSTSTEVTETDRLGQTLDYQFGPMGRPTQATFKHTDGSVESSYSVSYDPNTDLLSQTTDKDSTGATLRTFVFGYDNLDRLQSKTQTEGGSSWVYTYGYDDLDRRTSLGVTGQSTIGYQWDDSDNLTQISQVQNGTNRVFSFQYDALNRMYQRTLSNGVTTNWSFDDAGFLTGVNSQLLGTPFDTHTYYQDDGLGHTVVGQIVREVVYRDLQNGQTQNFTNSYGYDDFYRLNSATVESPPTSYSWQYDGVGNRTSQIAGVVSTGYTYDNANRLTAVNGAAVTNDANGNLTSYNGKTYTWDVRGRLASLTAASYSGVYTYDYQDRRASKMVNGASTWYRYDGDDLIGEISSTGIRFTLQGPEIDEPLAQFDGSFPNGLYPTPNSVGSSTTLTGPAGYVQSWYYYQPFGQTSQSNGGMLGENPFRFTGREDDADGLYFCRARYYSPDLGRFISEDPAGLDAAGNQYTYAGGNPVSYGDPLGLTAKLRTAKSLTTWFGGNAYQGDTDFLDWGLPGGFPVTPNGWRKVVVGDFQFLGQVAGYAAHHAARFVTDLASSLIPQGTGNYRYEASKKEAAAIVKEFRAGSLLKKYITDNYGKNPTHKIVGELLENGRLIRYPHTDPGTPELHYNLIDPASHTNLHLVIK